MVDVIPDEYVKINQRQLQQYVKDLA